MISEAKKSGATQVKFKFKNVDSYYSDPSKRWRHMPFSDYRKSLEIDRGDMQKIVTHCRDVGIEWSTTVHDQESLDFVVPFGPAALKIASMDAAKSELFDLVSDKCKELGIPFIYSMGGKTHDFYIEALRRIEEKDIEAYILHCVSIYPTPEGLSNTGYIRKMIEEVSSPKVTIGYSGHEVGYDATLVAALNGAGMIERHFSLSRDLKIHHLECALLPDEFAAMVSSAKGVVLESKTASDISEGEKDFLEKRDYGG